MRTAANSPASRTRFGAFTITGQAYHTSIRVSGDAYVQYSTLPIAPAERFDVVLDFSKYPLGSKVVPRNRQAHGAAGEIMRFDIAKQEKSDSTIPVRLAQFDRLDPHAAVATRFFDFSYEGMKLG